MHKNGLICKYQPNQVNDNQNVQEQNKAKSVQLKQEGLSVQSKPVLQRLHVSHCHSMSDIGHYPEFQVKRERDLDEDVFFISFFQWSRNSSRSNGEALADNEQYKKNHCHYSMKHKTTVLFPSTSSNYWMRDTRNDYS